VTDVFGVRLPDPIVNPIHPATPAVPRAPALPPGPPDPDPDRGTPGPHAADGVDGADEAGTSPDASAPGTRGGGEPGSDRAAALIPDTGTAEAAEYIDAAGPVGSVGPVESANAALVRRPSAEVAVRAPGQVAALPGAAIPAPLSAPDGPGGASAMVRVPSCPQLAPGARMTIVWSAESGTGLISRRITEAQYGRDITFVIPPGQIGPGGARVHYEVESDGTRMLSRAVTVCADPAPGVPGAQAGEMATALVPEPTGAGAVGTAVALVAAAGGDDGGGRRGRGGTRRSTIRLARMLFRRRARSAAARRAGKRGRREVALGAPGRN
jgi:hypothetical protein